MTDSLAQIEDEYVKMGSYVAIKTEDGNSAWVDPNGRVLIVNSDKEVLATAKAEAPEEGSKAENLATLKFDETMGDKFAEEFQ